MCLGVPRGEREPNESEMLEILVEEAADKIAAAGYKSAV